MFTFSHSSHHLSIIQEEVRVDLVLSYLARTAKCCRAIRFGGVTEALLGTRLFDHLIFPRA